MMPIAVSSLIWLLRLMVPVRRPSDWSSSSRHPVRSRFNIGQAIDSFGPIADNANGIGEMTGLDEQARSIMANLDAVGNTTKAITKGIAIASAVIAAVSLFSSFLTAVEEIEQQIQ